MLKIAICDDEWGITKQLEQMVRNCIPSCETVCYGCEDDLLAVQEMFDIWIGDSMLDKKSTEKTFCLNWGKITK